MAAPERPVRVLYIMGTARSGSTILEILLAHGKGAFGAGELTALVQDGWIEDKPCSCRASFSACDVWGRVRRMLGLSKEEVERWAVLQRRVDWHFGFLRQWLGLVSKADRVCYEKRNLALLRAIQEVTGAEVILDSSKYAGRALALAGMPGVDLRVICLIRSPEGLMASFQKPNKEEQRPKGPLAALAYYVVALTSLRLAKRRLGRDRVYPLRYESLMADPRGTLARLGDWAGLDLRETVRRLDRGDPFDVGHLVTGNRLRRKRRVRFSPSAVQARPRGVGAKLAVGVMNAWRSVLV